MCISYLPTLALPKSGSGSRRCILLSARLRHRELLMLAIATSIDALAVGVSFSMVELTVPIYAAATLIGCTTFAISVAGVFVGNLFGARYKNRAEFVGGAILILIGLKILLEHFGVL